MINKGGDDMAMKAWVMIQAFIILLMVIMGGWVGTSFAGPLQRAHLAVIAGQSVAEEPAGYTVSYEGSTQNSTGYTTTTARCTVPVGTAEGQLIVVSWMNDTGSDQTTTNADWTEIAVALGNNGSDQFCAQSLYRVAPSSPPEYYDINTTGSGLACVTTVYSKTGGSWAVSASTVANADDTSITTNNVTGYAGGAVQSMFYNDSQLTVTGDPAGTEAQTFSSLSISQSHWYRTGTTATTYSDSITWSASEQQSAVIVAIGAE
jgi:hypothetical protein